MTSTVNTAARLEHMTDETYHGNQTHLSRSVLSDFFDVVETKHGLEIAANLSEFAAKHIDRTKPAFKETALTAVGSVAHGVTLAGKPMRSMVDIIPHEYTLRRPIGTPEGVLTIEKGETINPLNSGGAINSSKRKNWPASHYQLYERERREDGVAYFLKEDDYHRARNIIAAIRSHEIGNEGADKATFGIYKDWVEHPDAVNEHAVFWTDADSNVNLRCKPDMMIPGKARVFGWDLKITDDPSPAGFRRKCKLFRYWLQDEIYRRGIEAVYDRPVDFYYVCVGSQPPHQVAVHEIDAEAREQARYLTTEALEAFAIARDDGLWRDAWQDVVNPTRLSSWDFKG